MAISIRITLQGESWTINVAKEIRNKIGQITHGQAGVPITVAVIAISRTLTEITHAVPVGVKRRESIVHLTRKPADRGQRIEVELGFEGIRILIGPVDTVICRIGVKIVDHCDRHHKGN